MELLTTNEVLARLRIGQATLRTWRRDPARNFPQPVLLGGRALLWKADEIDAWIASRMKGDAE